MSRSRRPRLSTPLVAALGCAALLLAPVAGVAQTPVFTAMLQSTQSVPPVTSSNAFGNAFMTFDISTQELCYSITYSDAGAPDLSSGETAAHFHGPAAPGVSAPVTFGISPDVSPLGSPKEGCVGPLTIQQRNEVIDGLWYINIHSNDQPGGEIRGQVLLWGIVP